MSVFAITTIGFERVRRITPGGHLALPQRKGRAARIATLGWSNHWPMNVAGWARKNGPAMRRRRICQQCQGRTRIITEKRRQAIEEMASMRKRTVGLYATLEKAQEALNKNWGGLNEAGWYPWAVIESVEFGLCPHHAQTQVFYEYWRGENEGWRQLPAMPVRIEKFMEDHHFVQFFAEIG